MIYVFIFVLLVLAIALVTDRLNTKTPCNHNWEKHENSAKCCNCGKKIPDYIASYNNARRDSFSEAA